MSHITHFYHLTALDYIDVTGPAKAGFVATLPVGQKQVVRQLGNSSGVSVVMAPWAPVHQNAAGMVPAGLSVPLAGPNVFIQQYNLVDALVGNYVNALDIRRKCHVLAAEIDGKHPCQNAQVPGGMTTKPSTVNWANVSALMDEIRVFINTCYLPDLITVALAFGGAAPLLGMGVSLFGQGAGYGRSLAWGAFPNPHNAGLKLFSRGTATSALAFGVANPADILEHTNYSHYSSPSQLHPSVGATTPEIKGTGDYTWHKNPRLNGLAYEVGPVARVMATALDLVVGGNPIPVTSSFDLPTLPGFQKFVPAGFAGPLAFPIECATNAGHLDHLGAIPIGAVAPILAADGLLAAFTGNYTLAHLGLIVLDALFYAFTVGPLAGPLGGNPGLVGGGITGLPGSAADLAVLYSTLGRHACRGIEAKYLADAMGAGTTAANIATGVLLGINAQNPGFPMLSAVIQDPLPGAEVYTYQVMPKAFKMGAGLTEAPRGALGHWITSEFRRIVNYQAVVPSTWNACGKDDTGAMGPIEQSIMGTTVGDPAVDPNVTMNNLLKAIHPFDICVACSVHVADTKGNNIMKFTMDPDGRVTKKEVATEE